MHLIVNAVSQLQVDNRHFKFWMPIKNIQKKCNKHGRYELGSILIADRDYSNLPFFFKTLNGPIKLKFTIYDNNFIIILFLSSILNYKLSTLHVHIQCDTNKITNFENHFQIFFKFRKI